MGACAGLLATPWGEVDHHSTPPKNLINPSGEGVSVIDTDAKQSEFKTLLQEEREKRGKPVTVQWVDKAWWKKEKSHWNSCPHVDKFTCALSKKFRAKGPFLCSGSWHEGCEIYLLVKNNGGDPTVLINE